MEPVETMVVVAHHKLKVIDHYVLNIVDVHCMRHRLQNIASVPSNARPLPRMEISLGDIELTRTA